MKVFDKRPSCLLLALMQVHRDMLINSPFWTKLEEEVGGGGEGRGEKSKYVFLLPCEI